MGNAIETKRMCYRSSSEFAIRELSLNVPTGALYGFLGPNGCGKTTTIRLLLGLLQPDSGGIQLLGEPVPRRLPAVLSRTGVIPDRPHLHRYLTIQESLDLHAAFYRSWDPGWARTLLSEFRLQPRQKVASLSKGETAKVLLILAVCQQPELLVLDEPMDGLDPVVRRDVLSALLDYVSARRATVFVSSHLVHELERFCDWIGVMDRGQLVVEMPMSEFRNGNKRLRLQIEREVPSRTPPFTVLVKEREPNAQETWVVRGWKQDMQGWFEDQGIGVREISDLDLEDGFVELLRAFRHAPQN